MGYIVSTLIVGLCLYLVIQPFLSGKKQRWRTDELKDDLDDLTLEQAYATINELEMEYNMGKLPEKDYQSLKNQYERIAAKKLKEDAYSFERKTDEQKNGDETKDSSIEAEIDKELAELRKLRKGE
ncbi:hypothetical protein CR194_09455 [Salipaludibacillus keqinensis]|uniref:C-type cytochrome biogenesis protein CcmI n=1 Tax=Salipaludibacillus keqinensis TaxID=2045207 RepID=A0A323TEK8_9BACI|nr:hypothetical protein [Salipaludibacillus keqinensis]PYZ93399.1 hypothetical protein CR194_09455 [Salipaludibacillus keqinensis]